MTNRQLRGVEGSHEVENKDSNIKKTQPAQLQESVLLLELCQSNLNLVLLSKLLHRKLTQKWTPMSLVVNDESTTGVNDNHEIEEPPSDKTF